MQRCVRLIAKNTTQLESCVRVGLSLKRRVKFTAVHRLRSITDQPSRVSKIFASLVGLSK